MKSMRFFVVVIGLVLCAGPSFGQIITTVAGNGIASFGGDGGPATNARLNAPGDVALDAAGNVFFLTQEITEFERSMQVALLQLW